MNQANRSKIQLKFIGCFVDGDTSGSRCRSQSVAINCKCVRFIPIVLPSVSLNFGVCLQMILRSFYHHCHLRFYFVSCVVSGESFINATLWETPSNTFREDKSKIALAKCEIYCKFARVCSSWMQFDSCIFSQFKNIRVAHLLRSQQYSFLERTWIRFVEGQIVKQQYNSLRTASHFWLHNSYTCSQNMMQWLKLMSKSKIRCSASYVILCHQIAVIHRSRWYFALKVTPFVRAIFTFDHVDMPLLAQQNY